MVLPSILTSNVYAFPVQTVSAAEKETIEWKKKNLDFFDYQAMHITFEKAEDMRKLRFINGERDDSMYKNLVDPLSLGADKKEKYGATMEITHYPILARPINTIVGECIKRPLNFFCKSESAEARNEYFRVKEELLKQHVNTAIQQRLQAMAQRDGVDLQTEEGASYIQAKTPEEIQDYVDKDYIDVAEQTANRVLKNIYQRENLDLEFVDGFRHGVSVGKEFYHTFVKDGKTVVKNISQDDVFFHKSLSSKWVSESQYAGIISYLTPSSIIDLHWEWLTSEDIEYIQTLSNGYASPNAGVPNDNNIHYNTDVYANFEGHTHASNRMEWDEQIREFQLYGKNTKNYQLRGLIKQVESYWKSYRKIGFLTQADDSIMLVDEYVKADKSIGESLEQKTVNQLYYGCKIADKIYKAEPYRYQEFDVDEPSNCPLPIEGCYYSNNYTKPIGLADLMLPWNELYDIVAYELKKDMNSSLGKVMFMSTDHIPDLPGFTMEKWYYWAREMKIAWVQQPQGNNSFAHFQSADMSFAEQMLAKMKILEQLKAECNSIGGFSEPRLGNASSENTLGQSSQSLVASVNQTEYWFFKHSHLVKRVLTYAVNLERQLMKNKKSTLRNLYNDLELQHIDSEGINRFTNEKIGIYITNSGEDLRKKQMTEDLVQNAISKGYDDIGILELVLSNSISETKNIYESIKRKADKRHDEEMQMNQKANEDNVKLQTRKLDDTLTIARERNASEERQSYISSFGRQENNMVDSDQSGTADILEYDKLAEIQNKNRADLELGHRKLSIEEQKIQNDAKMNKENNKTKEILSRNSLKNKVSGEK